MKKLNNKSNGKLEQACVIVLLFIVLAFIIVTLGLAAYNTGFDGSTGFVIAVLTAYACSEWQCMRAKDPKLLKCLNIIITIVALYLIIKTAYF